MTSIPAGRTSCASPILLIDEALHLLRTAPLATLAYYYIGSLPFVAGLLYFWSDMSYSAYAWGHYVEATLGMTVLFIWMKTWQARFCALLWGQANGREPPRWTFTAALKLASVQCIIQPFGLFLLPAAMVAAPLFPFVYGFYQAATVFTGLQDSSAREASARARRHALLWYTQNLAIIALLALFILIVFINLLYCFGFFPFLLKTLLGIETAFSRGGLRVVLNTTVISAACGLTYLVMDPAVKAVYVLRCFYGEATSTGADLQAELKSLQPVATKVLPLILGLALFLAMASAGRAAEDAPQSFGPGALSPPAKAAGDNAVSAAELDDAIRKTLRRREYAWRMPREKLPESKDGSRSGLLHELNELVSRMGNWVKEKTEAALKWLVEFLRFRPSPVSRGKGWNPNLRWLGAMMPLFRFLFILLLVAGAVILGWKIWKYRREKIPETKPVELEETTPDLEDENVLPDELPEDGWTTLARELIEQGDLRLGLRALYLGTLSFLGEHNLLLIAKFKSNRDYHRELARRAHTLPELLAAFAANVSTFERVWYGMRKVATPMLNKFRTNVDRIKTDAQT